MNGDARLLERASRGGGNLRVFGGQNFRQQFHHGHFTAECAVEAREFDPDRAGPNDEQTLGQRIRSHRFARGPDELPVGFDSGQRSGARTRGDHDRVGTQCWAAFDGNPAGFREACGSLEHLHLVLLEQARDAFIELLGDGA